MNHRKPATRLVNTRRTAPGSEKRVTLARALSKMGVCSRTEATTHILAGTVTVNGRVTRDPEAWVSLEGDRIVLSGKTVKSVKPIYLMLNKPRGVVTTAHDEKGRETVYDCFTSEELTKLGKISPVGRLDKASEGLLLFTNDTRWADKMTAPESHLEKIYHVQIDQIPSPAVLKQCLDGVMDEGELLAADTVTIIRTGEKNCWLSVTLSEGKNRQIRRILNALDIEVLRLIRVSIGKLPLGELEKGSWRYLTKDEMDRLNAPQHHR